MATSIHKQIMDAIKTKIDEKGLSGLTTSKIIIHPVATSEAGTLPSTGPCVLITPWSPERFIGGTNASDDIVYQTLVAIIQPADEVDDAALDARLLWRQQIIDALIRVRLGTTPNNYDMEITPGPVVDNAAWTQKGWFASVFYADATVRKERRAS